jgi:ribosomal protein S18 acetylase RimI-like enzyme
MSHPLDNPIWHALGSTHAPFAERLGRAMRYPRLMATFAAVDDPTAPDVWPDLAALIGPGGRAALFLAAPPDLPATLPAPYQRFIDQMIAPADIAPPGPAPAGLTVLGAADVPAMLDLVKRTEPGPMQPRTIEMGSYLGISDAGGALIAMAGERLAIDGFVEISAVCTAPEARGRGLAADLCQRLAHAIQARGARAFLHVKTENGARRVYERLGFTVRREIHLSVVQVPA